MAFEALVHVENELARLHDIIDRYHQHKTSEAREKALRDGRHAHDSMGPCPERAAIKRASMDLSRALAVLRREVW